MRALLIPTQLRAREIGIHRRSRTPHLPSQRLKDGIRSPVSSRRIKVVGRAELESATFWVVTRCSNPIELPAGKYLRELGLNQRPWAYETPALPLSYLAVKVLRRCDSNTRHTAYQAVVLTRLNYSSVKMARPQVLETQSAVLETASPPWDRRVNWWKHSELHRDVRGFRPAS